METAIMWHKSRILTDIKVLQAYVLATTPDKKILLVRDHDEERFTLPGGAIEAGETPEEGILRELQEEAQVKGHGLTLLGCIEVKQFDDSGKLIDHHQQVRYACTIDEMDEFIPRKDGFETVERITVEADELGKYIHWLQKPNGKALLDAYHVYVSALY